MTDWSHRVVARVLLTSLLNAACGALGKYPLIKALLQLCTGKVDLPALPEVEKHKDLPPV